MKFSAHSLLSLTDQELKYAIEKINKQFALETPAALNKHCSTLYQVAKQRGMLTRLFPRPSDISKHSSDEDIIRFCSTFVTRKALAVYARKAYQLAMHRGLLNQIEHPEKPLRQAALD